MNRREALRTLAAGGATGALAAGAIVAMIPAGANVADPMLDLIVAYQDGLAAFNASSSHNTSEQDEALAAVTWRPAYGRLCSDPPTPTTMAGAVAAVRLVADEEEHCGSQPEFTINTLRAALAYLEGASA